MDPRAAFSFFIDSWILERKIISFQGMLLAHCEGAATFQPYEKKKKNHLIYREKGQLTPGSQAPMNFYKEYHYHLANDQITLFFDSKLQKIYHAIDFTSKQRPIGNHFCQQDTYLTTYKFSFPKEYQTECKVFGPQKNYTIYSMYKRNVYPNHPIEVLNRL